MLFTFLQYGVVWMLLEHLTPLMFDNVLMTLGSSLASEGEQIYSENISKIFNLSFSQGISYNPLCKPACVSLFFPFSPGSQVDLWGQKHLIWILPISFAIEPININVFF